MESNAQLKRLVISWDLQDLPSGLLDGCVPLEGFLLNQRRLESVELEAPQIGFNPRSELADLLFEAEELSLSHGVLTKCWNELEGAMTNDEKSFTAADIGFNLNERSKDKTSEEAECMLKDALKWCKRSIEFSNEYFSAHKYLTFVYMEMFHLTEDVEMAESAIEPFLNSVRLAHEEDRAEQLADLRLPVGRLCNDMLTEHKEICDIQKWSALLIDAAQSAIEGLDDSGTLHYLLGMHYLRENTEKSKQLAVKEFEKAVAMGCEKKREQRDASRKLDLLISTLTQTQFSKKTPVFITID